MAAVEACLRTIAEGLSAMGTTLLRMLERCDPHIYFERVRLPTSGWRDNPALPHGLLYEGEFHLAIQECYSACCGSLDYRD